MKPLKLEFEGIRSFSAKTVIDFTPLTKGGLFGIFGSTGSGKSTILDAIIISLYGGLYGLNMAEIVSTRCKKAYVCFDFEIAERGKRNTYRVERSFSLSKEGAYRSSTAYLYELKDGSLISLAEKTNEVNAKIEEIIGLGQSEFTKCIILPQGEFSTFVKATKAERVKIIEKLFDLEKYGDRFNAKLKSRINSLDREIASLKGELRQFDGVTEEACKEAETEVKNCSLLLEELSVKQSKILEYIEKNQKFYNIRETYLKNLDEYNYLLKQEESFAQKESNLVLYEKAKLIGAKYENYKAKLEEKEKFETVIKSAKEEHANLKERMKACQDEFNLLTDLEREEKQLLERKQVLAVAKNDAQRLNDLNLQVKKLTATVNGNDVELAERQSDLVDYNIKKSEIEDKLKETKGKIATSSIFSFACDCALKEEYQRQVDYYGKQIEIVNEFKDESPLYKYVSNEYKNRSEEFTEKVKTLTLSDDDSVDGAISKYTESTAKINELESLLSKITVQIAKKEEEINSLKKLIQLNGENLSLATKEQDLLVVKLSKIIDNVDNFDREFTLTCDKIKFIGERQNEIKRNYKDVNELLILSTEKLNAVKLNYAIVNKDCENCKSEYQLLVEESELDGEKAKEILSTGDNASEVREEIENYRKRVEYLKTALSTDKTQLENSAFSIEEYEDKRKESAQIGEIREQNIKILGNLQNNVEKLSQKLKERCIIEQELLKFTARMSVYERLGEAIGRKSFTEFIASEFLCDVAVEARKTLLELTGGKYDVVYRDSSSGKDGFFVLDNLNGGVERSVSSLSGGETFLVSLSLALALSVNIYASSNKPMEFFFLDEGFGTLDGDLVEVVLDSLERLKNKNFTIGLISHLAEMKSRIDSKITVTPATESAGSTVRQTE
ncbi:MAG: SMC family ATPase [Clostridiales bacterium]|nr:SMC family ATPase [Clostridiales bacterium]